MTFDVKKIPSQKHREAEIKDRLAKAGYDNIVDLNLIGGLSFRETIQIWLSNAGAEDKSLATRMKRLVYNGRIAASRAVRYSRRRVAESAKR